MLNFTDATYEGEHLNVLAECQEGHFDNTFSYDEGTAPSKPDEIAVTSSVMKMLDVDIGDTLSIKLGDEYRSFIITGKYSSFVSPGVRFCDHYDLTDFPKNGCMGIQVKFTDDLTQKQLSDNIEKLKDLFDTNKIYSTSEFISFNTGIGDTLASLRVLTLILTVMVTAMVVVLMERSFISREKSEIALMKAVGISNFSIIAQHTIRFVITAVAASFLSFLAVKPLSEFGMNLVCSMIGDVSSVECTYNTVEMYLLQPAILIAATIISAFLTATYTRTIKASDTASIE
jgi:putative ABC transport system permease protein